MKIVLKPQQEEALRKGLSVVNAFFCMRVGGGKTFASMFLSRILMKNSKIDKSIFCVTNSGVGVFKNEFSNVGINIDMIETIEEFLEFLKNKDRFIIIKHSFMEELGKNKTYVDLIEDSLIKDYKKIMLIIDEAHRFSNPDSWANFGVNNTRKFYEKILILTATPYSSKLDQIFGLVKLIYPFKWKDLKEFRSKYVRSEIVKHWKTGQFIRVEDIEYINLPELRKELEEFTYFYFPPIALNYYEHKIKLNPETYKEYVDMCRNVYEDVKERSNKDKDKKSD